MTKTERKLMSRARDYSRLVPFYGKRERAAAYRLRDRGLVTVRDTSHYAQGGNQRKSEYSWEGTFTLTQPDEIPGEWIGLRI